MEITILAEDIRYYVKKKEVGFQAVEVGLNPLYIFPAITERKDKNKL